MPARYFKDDSQLVKGGGVFIPDSHITSIVMVLTGLQRDPAILIVYGLSELQPSFYAASLAASEFDASESTVHRYRRNLCPAQLPEVVARVETPAGEVPKVNFGDVGPLLDPATNTLRLPYVFAMVLDWSRHVYPVKPGERCRVRLFQKVPSWLLCHAVPQRIVLGNLKDDVFQAYAMDRDVEVQRAFAKGAEDYDFLIDSYLPAKPQRHPVSQAAPVARHAHL